MLPLPLMIGLGTLVAEDLACIAAGVLVVQGKLDLLTAILACLVGICAGDFLLFAAGRLFGRRALTLPWLRSILPAHRVAEASRWMERRGPVVVLLSRFLPGFRLATYFSAGILKVRFGPFALWFLVASAVWTPLLIGSTIVAGESFARQAIASGRDAALPLAGVVLSLMLLARLAPSLASFRGRRLLLGRLKRVVRWEFWPPWLAYLPLVPWWLWLALRHRGLTTFAAANPGIPGGGLAGESKSEILARLATCDGAVPAFTVLPANESSELRLRRACEFMRQRGLEFPIVLKPDIGERGSGVTIIRSGGQLAAVLRDSAAGMILQEYVDGLEFGVFYCRRPTQGKGRVLSITAKTFPRLNGDGRHSVAELILRDPRAVCLAAIYMRSCKTPLDHVPAPGESVALSEIGSHCRGAIFLDASALVTPELETEIDRIAHAHPGFYFGRFDLRVPSIGDLRRGRNLRVLELNGVASEATHVYDPAVSLLDAYRAWFMLWRLAFEIGAENLRRGAARTTLRALIRIVRGKPLSGQAGGGPQPWNLMPVHRQRQD